MTSFAKMMTKRTGEQQQASWLKRMEADDQAELRTFAAGISQYLAAVTAGLSLPYDSGATEGNVNRIKAIKRQMYHRRSTKGQSPCVEEALAKPDLPDMMGARAPTPGGQADELARPVMLSAPVSSLAWLQQAGAHARAVLREEVPMRADVRPA